MLKEDKVVNALTRDTIPIDKVKSLENKLNN